MTNLTTTFTSIVNRALIKLGEEPIATFDPDTPTTTIQKAVSYTLQAICDQVLALQPWATASIWYTFSSSDDATVPSQSLYTLAYNLPTGFIRLTGEAKINGYYFSPDFGPSPYKITGSLFLTYCAGWEIEYVKTQTINAASDTAAAAWSQTLKNLIANYWAYENAHFITGGFEAKKLLAADVAFMETIACMVDASGQAPQMGEVGVLADARWRGRDA